VRRTAVENGARVTALAKRGDDSSDPSLIDEATATTPTRLRSGPRQPGPPTHTAAPVGSGL
jgi:hypothetical protein